ncbi:AAA family ATPase [Dolichospermum sp. UHCC 0684]|uniref:AAA family ATPase n=1 Tax=unclassified Dolichospermum TaxID=2622029 RepID=UPI001445B133|nr:MULTISPECIES: AAA family ATPase [unclassified Dolichospermum]MEA5528229.1 AAA family ATPase [Dolichospermum sp. UHCC 0684]MTJ36089.1 AAA family ATPase [Dolichospermum sp. UHCC 0260]
MHIQRIQVPDFRALKNVDITFEKEFTPRIFPLGSQNGGGKSTLLQLIFVLLHCSGNPDRVEFIQNLLDGFHVNDESGKRTLAIIDIWDGSKTVRLDFFVGNDYYLENLLFTSDDINNSQELVSNHRKNLKFQSELHLLNVHLQKLLDIANINKVESNSFLIEREINKIKKYIKDIDFRKYVDNLHNAKIQTIESRVYKIKEVINEILNSRAEASDNIYNYFHEKQIEGHILFFVELLKKEKNIHICDFVVKKNRQENSLLCYTDSIDTTETSKFLSELSSKIFFSAHISQIFLFLAQDMRKKLFTKQNNNYWLQDEYYGYLKEQKDKLPGLFTYDFLAIDTINEAFKDARDDDFKQAIIVGEYGNSYKKLLEELHNILVNKKVNINVNLSGVNFTLDIDDTELSPEDLSHGELKRLCIYTWLKHNKIEDAIVLMDELEISFHPDWQYQIVRDLEEWGATNQYILATHSYELCNAVTPAHVKELDPKLQARTIQ